jgi:DNA-binding NarL/FixJ family response regulator
VQILELVAAGLSDKQIASKLRVSPRTVQSHLDRFFNQHDIHKRAAAVAYLLEQKIRRAHAADS